MGGLRIRVGGWRPTLPNYSRNVYLILLYTLGKGFQIFIGQVTTNLYAYSLGYHKRFHWRDDRDARDWRAGGGHPDWADGRPHRA